MEIALRFRRNRVFRWGLWSAGVILLLQTSLPLNAEIWAIKAYQTVGSPVASLTATCRFDPTCSDYALQVLQEDGLWKGNWKILKRLTLCSPIGYLYDLIAHG